MGRSDNSAHHGRDTDLERRLCECEAVASIGKTIFLTRGDEAWKELASPSRIRPPF